jgi:hypothetical protein
VKHHSNFLFLLPKIYLLVEQEKEKQMQKVIMKEILKEI